MTDIKLASLYQPTWYEVIQHRHGAIKRRCVVMPRKDDEPVALCHRRGSSIFEHAVQGAAKNLLDEVENQLANDRYLRDLSPIHYSAEKRGEMWSVLAHVTYMRRRR
jgi:hypothetical protein